MSSELLDALTILEKEKGISRDILIDAIEAALISAYRRNFNQAQNVRIDLNLGNGSMRVFARKEVVDEVFDPRLEISLEDAQKLFDNEASGKQRTVVGNMLKQASLKQLSKCIICHIDNFNFTDLGNIFYTHNNF